MIKLPFRTWLLAIPMLAVAALLAGCGGSAPLAGTSWPGITVADNNDVYYAYGKIYAIQPGDSGATLKWTFPTQPAGGQVFYAPPAVDGNTIYVTDYVDTLFAVDRSTGTSKWFFKSSGSRFVSGVAVGPTYLYAATVDGTVHALDKSAGTQAWKYQAGGAIWATPLLDGNTLYITSLDKHVYALDANTGSLLWSFPQKPEDTGKTPMGAIVATPTLHNGVLYFGSFNYNVYALDTQTRTLKWSYPTTNWVWSSPIFDEQDNLVIGADLDGHVFALNDGDGKLAWPSLFDTHAPVVGAPLLAKLDDGTPVVYVTSGTAGTSGNDPNLYVLKTADGMPAEPPASVKGTFDTSILFISTGSEQRPIPLFAPAVSAGSLLLLGAHQGNAHIYALDPKTLTVKWNFDGKKAEDAAKAASTDQSSQQGGLFSNPTFLNTLLIVSVVLLVMTLLTGRRGGAGGKK